MNVVNVKEYFEQLHSYVLWDGETTKKYNIEIKPEMEHQYIEFKKMNLLEIPGMDKFIKQMERDITGLTLTEERLKIINKYGHLKNQKGEWYKL